MDYFNVSPVFRNRRRDSCSNTLSFTQRWMQRTAALLPEHVATGENVAVLPCCNESSGKPGLEGEAAQDAVRPGGHCQSAAVTLSRGL